MRIRAPHRRSLPFVLLAGFCSLGAPLQAADLSIGHVEITQGLQDAANSIPLVRHKPTVVRVFPVIGGMSDLPQVSARLHASRQGQRLPDSPRQQSRGTVSPARAVDRHTDQSALIFELPSHWTSENTDFKIELEIPPGFTDDNSSNNQRVLTGSFQERRRLDIRFLKVRFRTGGPDLLPESRATRRDAIGWLQAIFPIAPENVTYLPWNPTEVLFENSRRTGRSDPARDLEGAELITELNTIWGRIRPPDLLFAWTPTNSFSNNGKSDPWFRLAPFPPGLGRVAFGNSNGERYRRTLAHEMAHNLGIRCHHAVTLPDDVVGYDVTLADPTRESLRHLGDVSRAPLFDLMKPGEIESNAWIVPWTYRSLFEALAPNSAGTPTIFSCDQTLGSELGDFPATPVTIPTGTRQLLAIRGEIHESGGSFFPFYEVPAEAPFLAAATTVPVDGQGRHEIRLLGTQAEILQSIRWSVPNDLDDAESPTASVPFTWFVPKREDVTAVLLLRAGVLLDTLVVSQRKPQIEAPEVGGVRKQDSFDGPPQELRTVRWKETATGPAGDPFDNKDLRHRLWFSNDNGRHWIPVAVNLSGSLEGEVEVEIDQSNLPGGPICMFKVTTSDGYNVTDRVSAPFPLPDRAPRVQIISPVPSSTILEGVPLRLVGEAFDPEEDLLPGDQLDWWLDGVDLLGHGTVLSIPHLSPRRYQIHLTARDKTGNTSDKAIITVDVLPSEEEP